jgi:hypothetical protein
MDKSDYCPLTSGSSASETSFWINLAALLIAVGALKVYHCFCPFQGPAVFVVFAVAITLSIVCLERIFFPQTCFYSKWKIRRKVSWERIFYKEVAFLVTMAAIGFLYWLLPVFEVNSFTDEYRPFLSYLVPFLIIASLPYYCLMDIIDETPDDIYCKLGRAIVLREKTVSGFELGNYIRSWLVKAFYLSLMQPAMMEKIHWLLQPSWKHMADSPAQLFFAANEACFFMDLTYASVGYLVNFKILNTQTRTAEPTLFGWTVAIMCYFPFWGVLFYPYFCRYDEIGWMNVFQTGSALWWIWFVLIIATELIYALASVAIGFRFSNLTYRGLVNTGPYRWTKHPAYVFKNISWWLLSVPFMAASPLTALKLSLLLLLNNLIYFLRARTEERHLSHYPEYVAYALEMNDKSIFRWVARIMPFLKYRPLRQDERLF